MKAPSASPSCQSRACRTRSEGDTGRDWLETATWWLPWQRRPPSERPSGRTGSCRRHLQTYRQTWAGFTSQRYFIVTDDGTSAECLVSAETSSIRGRRLCWCFAETLQPARRKRKEKKKLRSFFCSVGSGDEAAAA